MKRPSHSTLPAQQWTIDVAEERSRPTSGHDGQHSELLDAVLVMRRH